jgi:hypothetical protein
VSLGHSSGMPLAKASPKPDSAMGRQAWSTGLGLGSICEVCTAPRLRGFWDISGAPHSRHRVCFCRLDNARRRLGAPQHRAVEQHAPIRHPARRVAVRPTQRFGVGRVCANDHAADVHGNCARGRKTGVPATARPISHSVILWACRLRGHERWRRRNTVRASGGVRPVCAGVLPELGSLLERKPSEEPPRPPTQKL